MFKRDAIMTHLPTGRKVRIISADSDPRALVWVCFVDDPDRDMMVQHSDLAA